jgi:hypothetical protein
MGVLGKLVSIMAKRKAKEIDHILNHPVEIMEETLQTVLKKHSDTVIGRQYDFRSIRNSDDYASRIPLMDYEQMEPYLERVYANPMGGILTADPPFWYLTTSGTTGKSKYLPVNESLTKCYTKGSMQILLPFMNAHPENPKVFNGKFIVFAAAAVTGEINGIPLGYATGAFSRRAIGILKRLMKPGEEVFNILDMEEKMRAYAQVMATENVTAIQGITTLSLALVRRMQNDYGPWLLDQLKGTKHEKRLRLAMYDDRKIDVAELWPNLRLFFCGGIDTDPYRKWIEQTLPKAWIWEAYGGTEGVYGGQTMPEPGIQLFPNTNYLEFIPESEVEAPNPTVIPLSDVKKGSRYEMVITNVGGYYRYRLGDMMTFTSTNPYTVRGISRKGRVVNLSGEKISEAHVAEAISSACSTTGTEIMDYSVVGVVEDGLPHYVIAALVRNDKINAVEFIDAYETKMKAMNEEFRVVRETGALGATTLMRMRSSYFEEVVKNSHIQAKPIPLTTNESILAECEAA